MDWHSAEGFCLILQRPLEGRPFLRLAKATVHSRGDSILEELESQQLSFRPCGRLQVHELSGKGMGMDGGHKTAGGRRARVPSCPGDGGCGTGGFLTCLCLCQGPWSSSMEKWCTRASRTSPITRARPTLSTSWRPLVPPGAQRTGR